MSFIRKTAVSLAITSLSFSALAQTDAEHAQHHPQTPSKSASKSVPKAGQMELMAGMEKQMNAMREMHEKMVAAKTPEERNALMADHTKSMKDGMSMMGNMGMSGMDKNAKSPMDMAARQMMMEKRMDMMQGMMQMMMDRMPAPATK